MLLKEIKFKTLRQTKIIRIQKLWMQTKQADRPFSAWIDIFEGDTLSQTGSIPGGDRYSHTTGAVKKIKINERYTSLFYQKN